jgi:polynucleotide 5'-hydroxyl-kinase GRC3/NOL9
MGQIHEELTQRTMDNTPRTSPLLKDISISPEWEAAAGMISRQAGIVVVIGVPGSGKSTLSRYLVDYLTHGHEMVALIDCDVGQTHLGPPTTIGMSLYKKSPDRLDTLQPDYMRFIGAPSPVGHISDVVHGTKWLSDKAQHGGAEGVIINTSGLILGAAGTELKLSKVDVVAPQYVLALQESSEIESLLMEVKRQSLPSIIRLPVSDDAKKRSLEARRGLREEKYRAYFKDAKTMELPVALVDLSRDGQDRERTIASNKEDNVLLGLCDQEGCALALGILQAWDVNEQWMHVLTPLSDADRKNVANVRLGDIKVHPDGVEESLVPESAPRSNRHETCHFS